MVHLVRLSLSFVTWKDRKAVTLALRAIYRAETEAAARQQLDEFDAAWGDKYPSIADSWRRNWEHVIPFFAYPPEVRRVIYTTDAIESLHMSLRNIIKTRGSFPSA
jgi:transposase-like protein